MLVKLPKFRLYYLLIQFIELIRTRDPQELEKCDVVVDVGGVYDHNTHRYDHHQVYIKYYKFMWF
jgi:uncharacterized UPF0160 family protein